MAEKWTLEADYAGACTCNVTCPCNLGQNPTKGNCYGFMAFSITRGMYGAVDLSGRKVVGGFEIPGYAFDGNWKMALYVDEGATQQHLDAILQIFSGQAGGPFAELAPLVSEFKGVKRTHIEFKDPENPSIVVGTHVSAHVETLIGGDKKSPITLHNGMIGLRDQIRLGKTSAHFHDPEYGWDYEVVHGESTPLSLAS